MPTNPIHLAKLEAHALRMMHDPERDDIGETLVALVPLLAEVPSLLDRIAALENEAWSLRFHVASLEAFRAETEERQKQADNEFTEGMEPLPLLTPQKWEPEPLVLVRNGQPVDRAS